MQTYDLADLMRIGGFSEPTASSSVGVHGWGIAALYNEDGVLTEADMFGNLITNVGDEYYAERAAGIASPPDQVTGMRLGTGTTAVAKNGAGGAIVTYVTASHKAIDGSFPTSNNTQSGAVACRIQWKTTWIAGEATANSISEVVITNENPLTNVAGTAANTISRALLGTVVNKAAGDTLAITWNHDVLGA